MQKTEVTLVNIPNTNTNSKTKINETKSQTQITLVNIPNTNTNTKTKIDKTKSQNSNHLGTHSKYK